MKYFYQFLLVIFLGAILSLFIYGFLGVDRVALIQAIVKAYGFNSSAETALHNFMQLLQQGIIVAPKHWELWLAASKQLPANWQEFLQLIHASLQQAESNMPSLDPSNQLTTPSIDQSNLLIIPSFEPSVIPSLINDQLPTTKPANADLQQSLQQAIVQHQLYKEQGVASFMLTLELYWLLLKARLGQMLLSWLFVLPLVIALAYSLKWQRIIGQYHIVYTSPLKKTVYLYSLGITSWFYMLVIALPLPIPSLLATCSLIFWGASAYKLRQVVQVSRYKSALTIE